MKKKIHNYDFLIIGGGLIGSVTALALQQKKYKVLLLEKNPKIFDNRTLAVNSNSKKFLSSLGLWENFKNKPENIDKIIIKDYINTDSLNFENEKAMGYVVYNKEILMRARNLLLKTNSLIFSSDLVIEDFINKSSFSIKNKSYHFKKLILSVGKNFESFDKIEKNLFVSNHRSYVGFFNHSKIHNNIAYEIFTKEGPLAVLPSPKSNKKLSTFIFSTKMNLSNKEFNKILLKYFKKTHGSIKLFQKISSFAINPHLSKVKNNQFILLGDMLRSIHPVAGQGWNLGIKDIQTLCNLLDTYSITDINFNDIYYARRYIESTSYLAFTSILNDLYGSENFFSKLIIKFGYQSLLKISGLKKIFIKQAMGEFNLVG